MPSTKPLPTIAQFRDAYIDAIRTEFERADNHTGAAYDYFGGTAAVLWSREVQYARDLFRAIYVDDADGPDLTNRIEALWKIARVLDTYGAGYATFRRPTDAAGAETFHEGTRLRVGASAYAVAQEAPMAASALTAIVPIRATVYGPGVAVQSPYASIDDELNDTSWVCTGLTCADGTSFERAPLYRARARALQVENRVGYPTQIITACQNAGAAYVAAFPSTGFGPAADNGFSAIYMGDANYTGSQALSNGIALALEAARVLGADLVIGPMVPTPLAVAATVSLWDDPSTFDTNQLTNVLRGALLASFYSRTSRGFTFTRDSLAASMLSVSTALQDIDFTSPSADVTILAGSPPHFPTTLPRYQLPASAITFTFTGPN